MTRSARQGRMPMRLTARTTAATTTGPVRMRDRSRPRTRAGAAIARSEPTLVLADLIAVDPRT
jgi:hypothetical protein